MNFASFAYSSALPGFAPLQSLFRVFFAPPAAGSPQPVSQPFNKRIASQPAFLRQGIQKRDVGMMPLANPVELIPAVQVRALPTACAPRSRKGLPTLRVMRMLESGQSPKVVGRMVISGRMADVCAELDRLVSRQQKSGDEAIH